MEIEKILVLIRGAGDIASGAARRLFLAGFRVAMTELPEPCCIRRTVSFAEALFEKTARVEGVEGRRAGLEEVSRWRFDEAIPVIVDPEGASIAALHPDVLIDARMLKRNDGTRIDQAPLVGALGPGYTAGRDCHFVIETERGHDLGRVIYQGSARPDSGEPARFLGYSKDRTVYTTCGGIFHGMVKIGDWVGKGTVIGKIDQTAFIAGISGTVRGILRSGFQVQENTKIADIDPRGRPEYCSTVSDRTNAIAGGVLEGILALRKTIKN